MNGRRVVGIGEWHKQIGNGDIFGRVSKFLSMMKILVSEIQVFVCWSTPSSYWLILLVSRFNP